jgi:hypothetical protein
MSFIDYYDKHYAKQLGNRTKTFRELFEILESKNKDFYLIVETGCVRGVDNFAGDGPLTPVTVIVLLVDSISVIAPELPNPD